jgi:ABC-type branched-subunit amino acid transport system substrate-binding protein
MVKVAGSAVRRVTLAVAIGAGTVGAICATASSSTASEPPITLAMITSLTGPAASEFSQSAAGFNARIALQNAEGGVNGHKITGMVLDDQTSPTEVVTAVQDALSKGAFGIVSTTPLFFEAAKYPNQRGVPVTGGFFDGPEWGTQPYTNMFAADAGSVNPKYPVNTGTGTFLKAHGATVLCAYGYSISPSSSRAALGSMDAFVHAGGKQGELDTTVPFGGVDFTAAALVAKQKGCDAFYGTMDDNSNFALATAVEQAGIKAKVFAFPTGFEPSVIGSPAWHTLQGAYFQTQFRPFQLPDAGTQKMGSALVKYEHFKPGQFPSYSQYESWLGADLMIKGLDLAGKNPTRAAVIHDLRNLKSYNGGGLLGYNINYSTIFGHDVTPGCLWWVKAEKSGFVPTSSKTWCGTDLPGTTTVSSS